MLKLKRKYQLGVLSCLSVVTLLGCSENGTSNQDLPSQPLSGETISPDGEVNMTELLQGNVVEVLDNQIIVRKATIDTVEINGVEVYMSMVDSRDEGIPIFITEKTIVLEEMNDGYQITSQREAKLADINPNDAIRIYGDPNNHEVAQKIIITRFL